MSDIYFPPRELEVMSILWRLGSATVAEVREALDEELAYTSVLSALQTLEEKGYVRHEPHGRAYRYLPASTAYLPPPDGLLDLLARSGFVHCRRVVLGAGAAQLLIGIRR